MTKARNIADLLSTSNGKIAGANLDVSFENISDTGTEGTKVASGTTAERGSTTGQIRFNSTTGLAEYYSGTSFKSLDAPPVVSSIDVTEVDSQAGGNQTIVITGSGFGSGASVIYIGASGTNFNASTVTVDSVTQITAVAPKSSFLNAQEPYGVKVENASGLSGTLASQINIDTSPSWQTASGSLGSLGEATTANVSATATDADGDTIVYSVQSGSLPSGASLNTSTGAITGTLSAVSADTTSTFLLRATANTKTADRSFNIIVLNIQTGTSRSDAIPVSKTENPVTRILSNRGESNGSITEGVYWFSTTNTADETYKFPTVLRNFGSSTWLMIGKNFRPHAYKPSNSDSNTSGGNSSANNSAHSLSYGLIDSSGNAKVTNANILGSGSNASGSASNLGVVHAGVAIKSFGDNVWTQTAFSGKDNGLRYLTRSDLTDKIHRGQNPAQGQYEDDTFYTPTSGTSYMFFNTRTTPSDKDTMRLGLTGDGSTAHDTHNASGEFIGTTWYQDGNDNYANDNRDSSLNGIDGYISIWVK
jgi:hypothetical protein